MIKNKRSNLVKVFFNLSEDWHGAAMESLWAEKTPMGTLVIMNTPFFAKGVSFLDEVTAQQENNLLKFKSIVKKSGHSTYRILQPKLMNIGKFKNYWDPIEKLGATYESKIDHNALYAVDVPKGVDVGSIYELLKRGETDGIWTFEEGDYFPA